MCDDQWKDQDLVMFFIYTPVFTVSLASKKKRSSCTLSTPAAIGCRI